MPETPSRPAKTTVKPGSILRNMRTSDQTRAIKMNPSFEHVVDEPAHGGDHASPELTILRDGDHIQKIIARCGCGQEIVIHCDYEDGGA